MYEVWSQYKHFRCTAYIESDHATPLGAIRGLRAAQRRLGPAYEIWVEHVISVGDNSNNVVRKRLDLLALRQQHREHKALQS